MLNKLLLFTSLISFAYKTVANDSIRIVKEIKLKNARHISHDRMGNIYVALENGDVNKYNSQGEYLLDFSPMKVGDITLLEAWYSIKVFIFYREFQEYLILERFLGEGIRIGLPNEIFSFVEIATFNANEAIWAIDISDFSLKKYDTQRRKLLSITQLNPILDPREIEFSFIREYQNYLYLIDKKAGVLVFDNLGNYKKRITLPGLDFVSFFEEYMIYCKDGNIIKQHLYDIYADKITMHCPDGELLGAVENEHHIYVLYKNKLLVGNFP